MHDIIFNPCPCQKGISSCPTPSKLKPRLHGSYIKGWRSQYRLPSDAPEIYGTLITKSIPWWDVTSNYVMTSLVCDQSRDNATPTRDSWDETNRWSWTADVMYGQLWKANGHVDDVCIRGTLKYSETTLPNERAFPSLKKKNICKLQPLPWPPSAANSQRTYEKSTTKTAVVFNDLSECTIYWWSLTIVLISPEI